MLFYVGLHIPSHAQHVPRAFISVNRVRGRKKPVPGPEWIMDSGAFTEVSTYGGYRHGVEEYAAEVRRLVEINPNLVAAVAQDWMCEPWILEKTGLTVVEHQNRTVERYDALVAAQPGVYVMPVLQGYAPIDYAVHVCKYSSRLAKGAHVGVGSVCKRNGTPAKVIEVLERIRQARPDLRLHGFGLKSTTLLHGAARKCLYSADSMAWSFAARREGGGQNDWRKAAAFVKSIDQLPAQGWLF